MSKQSLFDYISFFLFVKHLNMAEQATQKSRTALIPIPSLSFVQDFSLLDLRKTNGSTKRLRIRMERMISNPESSELVCQNVAQLTLFRGGSAKGTKLPFLSFDTSWKNSESLSVTSMPSRFDCLFIFFFVFYGSLSLEIV